ncbi:hypothetical protein RvY_11457 [Ramazzottius varieornatus]|uniref:Uncharacterized protein n=1 Tax=Ramazzottius varieornatus TaxID=947166 RepID=A0A1D1VNX7_RAMVA|nr:hypothetical protein RvY_11457 [Ramazzottius varieornatus]
MSMDPMAKKDVAEVTIPNYTADVLKIMLHFLCSDRTTDLTAGTRWRWQVIQRGWKILLGINARDSMEE